MPIQLAAESHVPCFQERVGTRHPGYMISDRLPWRLRARPSATLHEIQVRSEERTCSQDGTEFNRGASRAIWRDPAQLACDRLPQYFCPRGDGSRGCVFCRYKDVERLIRRGTLELSFKVVVDLKLTLFDGRASPRLDPDNVHRFWRCQVLWFRQVFDLEVNDRVSVAVLCEVRCSHGGGHRTGGVEFYFLCAGDAGH
jgi:hypothetical protein